MTGSPGGPEREHEIAAMLADAGWSGSVRTPMGADWSQRRYHRIVRSTTSAVLMDAPADASVPAFIAIAGWLRGIGLHAPAILHAEPAAGLILLEDLGDRLLADAVAAPPGEVALYALATDAMLAWQAAWPPDLPRLDDAGLRALLELFLDEAAPAADATEFRTIWSGLLSEVGAGPSAFLYRDYHSQNAMWLPGEAGLWRLGLLDFQDAHCGPPAYDLVSLLQDARRDVGPEAAAMALARFEAARPELRGDALGRELAILGAQRAMRILGVLARLRRAQGKPLPPTIERRVLGHLRANLAHPVMADLAAWCRGHFPAGAPSG